MSFNPTPVGRETDTVTIANGTSLSPAEDLAGHLLVGFALPAAWTTADLTFLVSPDGVNYFNLVDGAGTEVKVVGVPSSYAVVDPRTFSGIRFIKVRSGTSGTPVNQGADRIVTIIGQVPRAGSL